MSDSGWVPAVLWSGAETGGWRRQEDDRPVERLVATPNVGDAGQLLPWHPASVAAAMRRVSDDRPPVRRWRDGLGAAALMTVGALSPARRLGVRSTGSLVDHVASELGFGRSSGIVLCGPPRANQKPVVQLHDRRGRTLTFVKVGWNDLTRRLLAAEEQALTALASVSDRRFQVPEVLASGTFGESMWLALAPVTVERRQRPDAALIDAMCVDIEHTANRWDGLTADAPFVARLQREAAGLQATEPIVSRLVGMHGERPIALAASHGDLVPWNVLTGLPRPAVWDWERYDPAVPVGADRIHHRAQVSIQRAGVPVVATFRSIATTLDTVVPELPPDQRDAHLDWYLADLLCRYERDAQLHPTPRLLSRITDLTTVLNERGALT